MVMEFGSINYNLWSWVICYGCTIAWVSLAAFYTWIYILGDFKNLRKTLALGKERLRMQMEKDRAARLAREKATAK
jgi:hypothetical protein